MKYGMNLLLITDNLTDEHLPMLERLKRMGYDGWFMIKAFGLALPHLAAATKIWRRMYENEEQLARDGLAFMRAHSRS